MSTNLESVGGVSFSILTAHLCCSRQEGHKVSAFHSSDHEATRHWSIGSRGAIDNQLKRQSLVFCRTERKNEIRNFERCMLSKMGSEGGEEII